MPSVLESESGDEGDDPLTYFTNSPVVQPVRWIQSSGCPSVNACTMPIGHTGHTRRADRVVEGH